MDYELTITIATHGRDENAGVRLLDGFLATHPETDPVVTQNTETGELSIVLTVELDDSNPLSAAHRAIEFGAPIFADGANASGLSPAPIVGVNVAPTDVRAAQELTHA